MLPCDAWVYLAGFLAWRDCRRLVQALPTVRFGPDFKRAWQSRRDREYTIPARRIQRVWRALHYCKHTPCRPLFPTWPELIVDYRVDYAHDDWFIGLLLPPGPSATYHTCPGRRVSDVKACKHWRFWRPLHSPTNRGYETGRYPPMLRLTFSRKSPVAQGWPPTHPIVLTWSSSSSSMVAPPFPAYYILATLIPSRQLFTVTFPRYAHLAVRTFRRTRAAVTTVETRIIWKFCEWRSNFAPAPWITFKAGGPVVCTE